MLVSLFLGSIRLAPCEMVTSWTGIVAGTNRSITRNHKDSHAIARLRNTSI
jgi:hypothetical protein